jgi:hypothetical protein
VCCAAVVVSCSYDGAVTLLGNFEDSTTIYIVQEMCGKVGTLTLSLFPPAAALILHTNRPASTLAFPAVTLPLRMDPGAAQAVALPACAAVLDCVAAQTELKRP